MQAIYRVLENIGYYFVLSKIISLAFKKRKSNKKPRLLFGPKPILNNKYFSQALTNMDYESHTIMESYLNKINKKDDFDFYKDAIIKKCKFPFKMFRIVRECIFIRYCAKRYDILCIPYNGIFFSFSKLKKYEAQIINSIGFKTILLPYGADSYIYSKIKDPNLQHVLNISYPHFAKEEQEVKKGVQIWQKYGSFNVGGVNSPDGFGRWDNLTVNFLCIDLDLWSKKSEYSNCDGNEDEVNIVHTPNHRGFKGTEFIIQAIKELKQEGLKINLILVEGIPNDEVKTILIEKADILIEQLIFNGYALSGIEGMASGLPVLSNLSNSTFLKVFRRYSYLNECPIIAANPDTIKSNLKVLIQNPEFRKTLGLAGRKYVEKYHSFKASQYMFRSIIDEIWYNKDMDLMNMYHPLNPDSYNNMYPKIEHPLVENKIPEDLMKKLNK
jgi:glycosyltransferase involved in cell wall biosynthesis